MIPETPHAPIATNQTIITGPKNRPMVAVPRRCTENSTTMMITVSGMTHRSSSGSTTLRPSMDDSTEMAGVIMLSPKNSAAPNNPSAESTAADRSRPTGQHRRTSVISAITPPSPSLSARITRLT